MISVTQTRKRYQNFAPTTNTHYMHPTKTTLPVTGMSCASCALSVEKALRAHKGILLASVNYAAANATIQYNEALVSLPQLRSIVRAAGYDLHIPGSAQSSAAAAQQHYRQLFIQTIVALIFSAPLMVVGMFFMSMPYANYIMWALATPVVAYPGWRFYKGAIRQLQHRTANMDTLVALSTGVAYIFSVLITLMPHSRLAHLLHGHVYFEAAAVVIAFVLLGKVLEERAKHNTSGAIRRLAGLQPTSVLTLHPDGTRQEVPISDVQVGHILIARPGERLAVDGIITDGASFVDESMITGEPIAVEKSIGAKVFAGTINQKGSLTYKALQVGQDTFLAHIIRLVQEAQGSKAPVQALVDRVAAVFVPVVLGIAVLSLLLWAFLGGQDGLAHGFSAFVTVLVIACPCALGLATPTALIAGIGRGAEMGLLIKDAQNLERAHKLGAIALDKTGTITEGRPVVAHLSWAPETDVAHLANVLLSLEQQSEHPLAGALVQHLKASGAVTVPITMFSAIAGGGVTGFQGNTIYFAGSYKLLQSMNITIPQALQLQADEFTATAHTVIWLSNHAQALGIAALTDQVKPTSATAIARLQAMGIEVHMLTGDNPQTAAHIAKAAGIRHVSAAMSPSDKAAYISSLQHRGLLTAMVGDGINDGQALAQADVSIAMGRGTDIAKEVAGITIISGDLNHIPAAISLSSHTMRVIRQNLFWAFIYNVIGIPIAAGILIPINGFMLSPMLAGAAMALSSVSVVTNSLRLRWQKL